MTGGVCVRTIRRIGRAHKAQALAVCPPEPLSVAEIMPPPVFLADGESTARFFLAVMPREGWPLPTSTVENLCEKYSQGDFLRE